MTRMESERFSPEGTGEETRFSPEEAGHPPPGDPASPLSLPVYGRSHAAPPARPDKPVPVSVQIGTIVVRARYPDSQRPSRESSLPGPENLQTYLDRRSAGQF